ncbi:divergent PAP2 family protein [Paenibacillus montanisoli]|uniref:Divergent PAP2 family protein n=1 Tax=Paenibacillus montanisoli TaxID=2081970 RepID=A0A328U7A0_9BACL|nr:divergent PAP2 family protein [Paenibacillus montanisoli]RAP75896.1 divergent PAP2 family protein [Paenibacillus montanisoli]
MSIVHNLPLWAAILAIVTAQAIKVPIAYFVSRKWNLSLAFTTGGMPSSHSAAVVSLATAIGLDQGWSSTGFAIASVVGAITMYDAIGIRRQAGIHAVYLNQVIHSLREVHSDRPTMFANAGKLKELLGHYPIEVGIGAIWGALVGIFLNYCFA